MSVYGRVTIWGLMMLLSQTVTAGCEPAQERLSELRWQGIHMLAKETAAAVAVLEQALQGYECLLAVPDHGYLGRENLLINTFQVHDLLATANHKLGHLAKAIQHKRQAIAIQVQLKDQLNASVWRSYPQLARLLQQAGYYQDAEAAYQAAIHEIETTRELLRERENKLWFIANKLPVYDEFIGFLQQIHRRQPTKGYDRKALAVFELKQGRVFLEDMAVSGSRRFSGVPAETLTREAELEQAWKAAYHDLIEVKGNEASDSARINAMQTALDHVNAQRQAFIKTLRQDYPYYAALKYLQPADTPTLQNLLRPDELLLVYKMPVLQEKSLLLWVIGKEIFQLLEIEASRLNENNAAVRRALQARSDDALLSLRGHKIIPDPSLGEIVPLEVAAHALYQRLIPETIQPLLKDKTLYIVPTGALYELPFEALVTQPAQQNRPARYLIEDHPVSYLSSASLLKIIRDARHRRAPQKRLPLLAFADPVYKAAGYSLPPLPETAAEAEAIAQVLSAPVQSKAGIKTLQLRGDASRSRVFAFNAKNSLEDYRYLLFAMHGLLTKVDKLTQPALALSYPETDGYLTMADIFGLQLNADFIMLSACNTGSGDPAGAGEGIRGLTGAFMYAGTPAVAVTLWSVETHSAKALSTEIFRQLHRGLPVAEALRAAKLKMLRGESEGGEAWCHPFFWAAFAGFGDGR